MLMCVYTFKYITASLLLPRMCSLLSSHDYITHTRIVSTFLTAMKTHETL